LIAITAARWAARRRARGLPHKGGAVARDWPRPACGLGRGRAHQHADGARCLVEVTRRSRPTSVVI